MVRLRYRNGAPLYGKTLQTVLGERPCRVIVVADPAETATDGAPPRLEADRRMTEQPPPSEIYRGVDQRVRARSSPASVP